MIGLLLQTGFSPGYGARAPKHEIAGAVVCHAGRDLSSLGEAQRVRRCGFIPTKQYRARLQEIALPDRRALLIDGVGPTRPWKRLGFVEFAALLKELQAAEPPELAVALKGTNVYGFLKGKAGAHKRITRGDDIDVLAPFETAPVQVEAHKEDDDALRHLGKAWLTERLQELWQQGPAKQLLPDADGLETAIGELTAAERPDEAATVIRIYMREGDRQVRDLHTGVRTTRARDVLDGQIDTFILAYLKTEEAAVAWG